MDLRDFKLERFFDRYEFAVEYLLCSSDCESITLRELLQLEPQARDRLENLWLGYTESAGGAALRKEIAGMYAAIQPEDVLVHSGAEEAIFLFMHAMLRPGDHVIVHTPCYQSLTEVARSAGAQVSPWPARAENNWALDPDELKRLLRPNTRAVILNLPHNPTGWLMDRSVFEEVNSLTSSKGIILFNDEVYRGLEYRPADRLPAACDLNPLAVSLGVLSKTYGLAGLRIGWVATRNRKVLERMAAYKDYTTICNSAPSELLAEVAVRHRDALARRNLEIISRNLDLLDPFFAAHPQRFTWKRPAAGSIAFPRLVGEDVEQFCDRLARQSGVLLAPGPLFGDDGNHFRIGFGRASLAQALEKLERFLSNDRG